MAEWSVTIRHELELEFIVVASNETEAIVYARALNAQQEHDFYYENQFADTYSVSNEWESSPPLAFQLKQPAVPLEGWFGHEPIVQNEGLPLLF